MMFVYTRFKMVLNGEVLYDWKKEDE